MMGLHESGEAGPNGLRHRDRFDDVGPRLGQGLAFRRIGGAAAAAGFAGAAGASVSVASAVLAREKKSGVDTAAAIGPKPGMDSG